MRFQHAFLTRDALGNYSTHSQSPRDTHLLKQTIRLPRPTGSIALILDKIQIGVARKKWNQLRSNEPDFHATVLTEGRPGEAAAAAAARLNCPEHARAPRLSWSLPSSRLLITLLFCASHGFPENGASLPRAARAHVFIKSFEGAAVIQQEVSKD